MLNITEAMRRRNFATFEAGDDVRSLGYNFLRDLAKDVSVEIEDCYEDPYQLEVLAATIDGLTDNGTQPVEELSIGRASVYVEQSGILNFEPRGLHTRHYEEIDEKDAAAWVIDTSHATWLDRAVDLMLPHRKRLKVPQTIFVPGQRLMDGEDEALNPNVASYKRSHEGEPPTEEEYCNWYVRKRFCERGFDDQYHQIDTDDVNELDPEYTELLDEIGNLDETVLPYIALFRGREDLENEDIFARGVGAASIVLACRLHIGGRLGSGKHYDSSPERPQVIMRPLLSPLAVNEADLTDPGILSPYTALSSVARAARWMIAARVSYL